MQVFGLSSSKFLFVFFLSLQVFITGVHAGQLEREDVSRQLDGRYTIGEVQADMRAYPVFTPAEETADGKPKLLGYAFETVDFTNLRGYSGKPINLFVFMDLDGRFLKINLIDHTEPLFLSVFSHAKLVAFAAQYVKLTFHHFIEIHGPNDPLVHIDRNVSMQGVHRGTISAKAIDRSLLAAAAKVARAKLDPSVLEHTPSWYFSGPGGASAVPAAAVPDKTPEPVAPVAGNTSREPIVTTYAPAATKTAESGDTKDKVPASEADKSAGKYAEVKKPDSTVPIAVEQALETVAQPVVAADAQTRLDQLERIQHMDEDSSGRHEWLQVWQSRRVDITVLLLGLVVLTTGLIAQKRMSATDTRLRILRSAYLVFTVGFIGWYAQGQLSIINITGAIESLSTGGDLSFLMNDPITVILWVFVAGTLLVWGRGTFCGWLCPFGALQELISLIANAAGLQQRRLRAALDRQLKWLKYGVLATILVSIFTAPSFARIAIEVEPFKTAISLYFDREWPFVLWALLCLALGVFVYRGYCRYICPLGAALASVNFLQRWSWIPRRNECGTPCQSCRYKCEYQAIEDTGKVNYSECFQCLDCVSIYQDTKRCLPLIQEGRAARTVIPVVSVKEN